MRVYEVLKPNIDAKKKPEQWQGSEPAANVEGDDPIRLA
jgi:hypothetical protein